MSFTEIMRSADKFKKIEYLIANQDIESVKIILQRSTDLCDLMNGIGETLIHLAVNHRCIDLIHWLLQNNIDVNCLDFTKKTALHLAVSLKFDDVVECLFNYNAKIDMKDIYGHSPFHLAVISRNVNLIQTFLNHGANVMDTTSENLQTCFHLALQDENYEVFELLLQNYKGSMDVSNAYGETILNQLSRKKNKRLVKMLLERGVNFEKVDWVDTSLHIASQERNYSIVELLLQYGANVNSKNIYNEIPLHIAIKNADVELVKLLLSYGADAKALTNNKNSALHLLINYFNQKIFEILLNLDIDIDANNGDNFTPFHLAVFNKNNIAIKMLLNKGANIDSISSKSWVGYHQYYRINDVEYKNLRPLHTAIIIKNVEIVKFLLKKGAKVDLENQTETYLAVDVVSSEILELLLSYGANLNIVNKEGESLFYRAIKYCDIRLTETFLSNGAKMQDILVMGKPDEPVLHLAVKLRNDTFVQFLLDLGVDINFLDSNKDTALQIAQKIDTFIAERLIRHIALIKINNGHINEQNQYILDTFAQCKSYFTMCLAELDKLKEAKSCGISLTVFLTKNKVSSSKVLRNQNVISEFLEILSNEKYPIYSNFLVHKMIKAVQRWNLVNKASRILNSFGCFDILYDVSDYILDNFSDSELEQFIQSFKINVKVK